MKKLLLKNGAIEEENLVEAAMITLTRLAQSYPLSFSELVTKCRDESHEMPLEVVEELKGLCLVWGNEKIHDPIRNILLSAVEGEGFELTSPIA